MIFVDSWAWIAMALSGLALPQGQSWIPAISLMSLSQLEYHATREKLARAEAVYAAALQRPIVHPGIDELGLRSLASVINQMKKELAVYEAGVSRGKSKGLRNDLELKVTHEKLARLEKSFDAVKQRPVTNPETRELTLRSLKSMINQLKEEIARYQAHAVSRQARD